MSELSKRALAGWKMAHFAPALALQLLAICGCSSGVSQREENERGRAKSVQSIDERSTTRASSQRDAPQAGTSRDPACPLELKAAIIATVAVDTAGAAPECEVYVKAIDENGRALELRPSSEPSEFCTFKGWGGWPGAFTVTAAREGFTPASKTIWLKKLRCGVSMEFVKLSLKRSEAARNPKR